MFCVRCGNQANEGAAFCNKCGAPMDAAVPVQQPAFQQPALGQQAAPSGGASVLDKLKANKNIVIIAAVAAVAVIGLLFALNALRGGGSPEENADIAAIQSRISDFGEQFSDTLNEQSQSMLFGVMEDFFNKDAASAMSDFTALMSFFESGMTKIGERAPQEFHEAESGEFRLVFEAEKDGIELIGETTAKAAVKVTFEATAAGHTETETGELAFDMEKQDDVWYISSIK